MLKTPALGTILPLGLVAGPSMRVARAGVTRDSILQLARRPFGLGNAMNSLCLHVFTVFTTTFWWCVAGG